MQCKPVIFFILTNSLKHPVGGWRRGFA